MAKKCVECGADLGAINAVYETCNDCWRKNLKESSSRKEKEKFSPLRHEQVQFSPHSGWAVFFYFCAAINFVGWILVAIVTELADFAIYGIAAGISCLFFAFICQAIVDIRYIL